MLTSEEWRLPLGQDVWDSLDPAEVVDGPTDLAASLREIENLHVFWIGESFQDLPLSRVSRHAQPDAGVPADYVRLTYGTCEPTGGGCMPPLQIRVEPYCYRPSEQISDGVKETPVDTIREGAEYQFVAEGLVVWTGDVVIKLDGWTDLLAAAEKLVALTGDGPRSSSEPLLPPNTDCSDFQLEPHPAVR